MIDKPVSEFLKSHFRHFNAATVIDAAEAYKRHVSSGGKMLVALGGAMSTAELGVSLAEMIRGGYVHAISCTGANLEEDVFNLVAHDHYERIPNYRDLTPQDELLLLRRHMNRVTDTCIPEFEAMRRVEGVLQELWMKADRSGGTAFPHETVYEALRSGMLEPYYQIDPKDSWVHAAMEEDLPIVSPGWEDSTCGNAYASYCMTGLIKNVGTVRHGIEYMKFLADWYSITADNHSVGFFQIGGGIAGDFAICAVPMLRQDLKRAETPLWAYFCQISDSTTSYGSYSGAVPNEKITWGKLAIDTPRYLIESDASIVAPLIFAQVLGL